MRLLAHVLHICADQHFAELHEVTMRLVFYLNDALKLDRMSERWRKTILLSTHPWILSGANHFAAQLDELGAANHCKGDMRVHLRVDFVDRLVVGRELIDLNAIRFQLFVDFRLKEEEEAMSHAFASDLAQFYLKLLQLAFRDCVSFGDDWNDVHFGV